MKILIVGGNKPGAIERYYIAHLTELGAEVHLYPAPDIVFDYHSRNILNKILFKSKIRTGYATVNKKLKEIAKTINPDVIWVFKGMEIYPATLEHLSRNSKLANYNPDHPFIIESKGGGNSNVRNGVRHYHLHFCYSSILQKRIEEEYHIPTVFLPFGFELSSEDYDLAAGEQEIERVCFIGNPDKDREEVVKFIADGGFQVDVYGHGWNKTTIRNHQNLRFYDAVYGLPFWKLVRAYRVQLNIFRKHNIGSHNMRSFEIPAVGGIQLAPYSEEHAAFFRSGKEIFLYKDKSEILNYLKALMNYDKIVVEEIRLAGRERSLNSLYSYKDRAFTVYKTFQNVILNKQ